MAGAASRKLCGGITYRQRQSDPNFIERQRPVEEGFTTGADGGSMAAAIRWAVGVLTGSLGTSACVLAVAAVGGLLLSGSLPVRRGLSVIVGCFVILSAGSIADALTTYTQPDTASVDVVPMPIAPAEASARAAPASVPDPYGFPPANQ